MLVPGVHRCFKYGALSLTKNTIQITFESKATVIRWLLTIQCYDLHHIFIMLSSVVMQANEPSYSTSSQSMEEKLTCIA